MSFLGRKRTRLSDRDQVIDALGAAYADGQIDEHEHELRVARALRSVEMQTLRAQIHDLQVPDDHPAAALLARRDEPEVAPAVTGRTERRSRRWVAIPVAVLVAGIGVGVAVDSSNDDADDKLDLLTVACLQDLVADVEEEFGSSEVVSVELHDTWAYVLVPTGDGGRYERYTYSEDGFNQHQGGSLAEADPDLVTLSDLDLARLVDHVDQAPERLGMDGELETVVYVTDSYYSTDYSTVVLGTENVPPHLEISLTNEFMEQASMATDLAGRRILDEQPLERDGAPG
jgi:hypothetical protein